MNRITKILIILTTTLACIKAPNDTQTFTIQGKVKLAGQQDHSGIQVALYDTTAIDTTLIRFKKQYPNVGTVTNQAFYFDHRLAQPVYRTETDAGGRFKLDNIEAGEYNLVASKNGFGWKYLTNLHSANARPLDIELKPELKIEENITDYTVWEAGQHYIISGNVTIAENATLFIDRGAVLRFSPAAGLFVNGTLEVNGEENDPVIFTLDGREPEQNVWHGIKINGMNATATLRFAKIENAKYGLFFKNSQGEVEHCMLQKCDYGIFAAHESDVSTSRSTFNSNNTYIHIEGLSNAQIEGNMLMGNDNEESRDIGIYSNNAFIVVENNICTNFSTGIKIEYNSDARIQKNLFDKSENDIYISSPQKIRLEKNTFNGPKLFSLYLVLHTANFSKNNFFKTKNSIAVLVKGRAYGDINATSNYWGVTGLEEAKQRIKDERFDLYNEHTKYKVNIEPIALEPFADAYPE